MLVFGNLHFVKKDWYPTNFKPCKRGEWNSRMIIETVLSMLTVDCRFKHLIPRVWDYFEMWLDYTMAMFNLLVQWHGLEPDENGMVRLSISEFSL